MPAGYSSTPLVRKLGLAPGQRVVFVGAPENFERLLGPLPEGLRRLARPGKNMDFVHLFCTRRRDLERQFAPLAARLSPAGMLWVSWPKRASGLATDLTGDVVRAWGLGAGLVDVKACAVDEVWSGLKFVRRLRDRG